jgi:hypothetical protein
VLIPNLPWIVTPNATLTFCFSAARWLVSVSKWNPLLGKEGTPWKESHFDANNEEDDSAVNEDGIAMADVVDTTEFPGSDLVPIEDGLVGVSVLQQTVGVVDDLVVCELPTHSTPHSEGGDFNWLDKNEKRDSAFFSPSRMMSPNATPVLTLYPRVFSPHVVYPKNGGPP